MKRATILFALLFISACATGSEEETALKRTCPQVAIVRALEKAMDYGGEAAAPENLVAVGGLVRVDGACAYEDKGVEVNFALTMAARKGPRLGGNRVSFPYFTAVTNAGDKVTAKEMMTAEFEFSGDDKLTETTQPLRVFIPLEKGADAGAMRVLIGFQLTESQIKASGAYWPQ